MSDGVSILELTVHQPVAKVFIVFVNSLVIGFLNGAARGSVVPGNCQPHAGAVPEHDWFLYEAFAEGAPSYDCSAVIILHRTGKDLTG